MAKINLTDLSSDRPKIKYGCAKKVVILSAQRPAALYADLPLFVRLMNGENQILHWTALMVIGNLAVVDRAGKINKLVLEIIKMLNSGKLVTAAHAAHTLGKIAQAKPYLRTRIFNALIKVEHYKYPTAECRKVVIGHVLNVLSETPEAISDYPTVIGFIKRQTKSSRTSVRKTAQQLLKTIK